MAYDTERLKKKAIEAIKEHRLFFIEDVVAYLPCVKQTFYDHELDESDDIKELLERNRIEVKVSMRSKWYKSDNPTLQMGLMKLIATDQERANLSMQKIDHVSSDGSMSPPSTLQELYDAERSDPESES